MKNSKRTSSLCEKINRTLLGIFLSFMALNAFGGGVYGMLGANEIPLEWLDNSPFTNYFFPSLILFVVVGGIFALAAYHVFSKHRLAFITCYAAVGVVLGWLFVQIFMIGFVSWLQPFIAIFAGVILLFSIMFHKFSKSHNKHFNL